VDWRGYELHPDTPPGGVELARKFGPERVGPMREHLRRFAAGFGITDMQFRDRSPNTRRALALAEFARDQGQLDAFRALAMDAHWRRGLDLEREADLRALSGEAGLDPDSALAASRDARYLDRVDARRREAFERGVTGIPTFVVGERGIVGCQPYEVLSDFVEACGGRRREGAEARRPRR